MNFLNQIDWTDIIVAVIGLIATISGMALRHAWHTYVMPWLEARHLVDDAKLIVKGVEALVGRHAGEEKWRMALEKMKEHGWNVDSDAVVLALKAAWKELDLDMIEAGEKVVSAEQNPA